MSKQDKLYLIVYMTMISFAILLIPSILLNAVLGDRIGNIQSEYHNTQDELSLVRDALNDSYVVNYEFRELNDMLLKQNEDLREDILFLRIELGKVQKEYEEYIKEHESSSISRGSLNREEMILFYKLVESEATGQSFESKVNVANVILNRVESDQFPNTITSVVYQPRQFSVVSDNRINQVKITNSTIEAVEYAMNNKDTTDGSLFFMNQSIADKDNADWFVNSLEYIMSDDSGHSFYK